MEAKISDFYILLGGAFGFNALAGVVVQRIKDKAPELEKEYKRLLKEYRAGIDSIPFLEFSSIHKKELRKGSIVGNFVILLVIVCALLALAAIVVGITFPDEIYPRWLLVALSLTLFVTPFCTSIVFRIYVEVWYSKSFERINKIASELERKCYHDTGHVSVSRLSRFTEATTPFTDLWVDRLVRYLAGHRMLRISGDDSDETLSMIRAIQKETGKTESEVTIDAIHLLRYLADNEEGQLVFVDKSGNERSVPIIDLIRNPDSIDKIFDSTNTAIGAE